MAKAQVKAVHVKDRVYLNTTDQFALTLDFNEGEAPGASQYFLASLASCKIVSLLELRTRFKMDISEAWIEVFGETGRGAMVEGTHFPTSSFKRIEYVFHVATSHTDEELFDYLRFVNAACTMGNSVSEKIEQIYRFVRI